MEDEQEKKPDTKKWWLITIGISLLICIVGFFLTLYLSKEIGVFDDADHCPPAQFGNSFGAVCTLISAFAFAGMIVTFVLQRYELSLQREELKAQRSEFATQNETLRLQRFEKTFFNMMELQQNIVNDLYTKVEHTETVKEDNPNSPNVSLKEVIVSNEYKGRNMFYYVFNLCKHKIENKGTNNTKDVYGLSGVLKTTGIKEFDSYYTTTFFDHYFRHLYTILKFINQNDWLGEDLQYKYATFVRATLSRYELVLLYYNGFFHPKIKALMEKYCMLNNLRIELLPLSYENSQYLRGLGLTVEDLTKNNFSGGDFEFLLTDSKNDANKYYIGAFYTKKEQERGKRLLNKWNAFISRKVDLKDATN